MSLVSLTIMGIHTYPTLGESLSQILHEQQDTALLSRKDRHIH